VLDVLGSSVSDLPATLRILGLAPSVGLCLDGPPWTHPRSEDDLVLEMRALMRGVPVELMRAGSSGEMLRGRAPPCSCRCVQPTTTGGRQSHGQFTQTGRSSTSPRHIGRSAVLGASFLQAFCRWCRMLGRVPFGIAFRRMKASPGVVGWLCEGRSCRRLGPRPSPAWPPCARLPPSRGPPFRSMWWRGSGALWPGSWACVGLFGRSKMRSVYSMCFRNVLCACRTGTPAKSRDCGGQETSRHDSCL